VGAKRRRVGKRNRIIGWKRALRSSSPTITPTPPCLLNHIPKYHICKFLNTSRDGDSTTFLGSLFQCLTALSVKKFFLISKSALMQLETVASHQCRKACSLPPLQACCHTACEFKFQAVYEI